MEKTAIEKYVAMYVYTQATYITARETLGD